MIGKVVETELLNAHKILKNEVQRFFEQASQVAPLFTNPYKDGGQHFTKRQNENVSSCLLYLLVCDTKCCVYICLLFYKMEISNFKIN